MPDAFQIRLTNYQQRVNKALITHLPKDYSSEHQLVEAMHYAVIDGGKRIRPAMVYAAGEAVNADDSALDCAACAVEMIHAYSLIHDDLPAMDNDDLRRGKPTCHKAFNEATAILAGDALQALAYEVLANNTKKLEPQQQLNMLKCLTKASGAQGMAGGQAIDLAAVGNQLNLPQLETMHQLKTGALIEASIMLGALCKPNLSADTLTQLKKYARHIGLSFQIHDDVLDIIGDTKTLGKPQGSDLAQSKPTFPALLGLAKSQQLAQKQHQLAIQSLESLGEKADSLRLLSAYIIDRQF